MKKCPFCAEEIQEEAVKCKHCGEMLIASNCPSKADKSSIMDGVRIGWGMFVILPLIVGGVALLILILLASLGGMSKSYSLKSDSEPLPKEYFINNIGMK